MVVRHAETLVKEALTDTRVVLINGARQSGKSTLVKQLVNEHAAEWRDLDVAYILQGARADPDGFVDVPGMMVIDEIQRAPELLLAIKAQVDADQRPGRFLLTGSSRVLALRTLPDTLVGRMETIELWPFSQGEIDGAPRRLHRCRVRPRARPTSHRRCLTSRLCGTRRAGRFSGSGGAGERSQTAALLQLLCRSSDCPRHDRVAGDRTSGRAARAHPATRGTFRTTSRQPVPRWRGRAA
ncbi:ATP-binding protein [Nonomuraea ferruginea]